MKLLRLLRPLLPAALAAALLFPASTFAAATPATGPVLGVQAWTFRAFSFHETVLKVKALGLGHLQAYPGQRLGEGLEPKFHHDMKPELRDQALAHLRANGVKVVSYGVVKAKTEAEWRRIFEFARAFEMTSIAVEPPDPAQLPVIAGLAREFGIPATLHNHAPPAPYADPAVAMAAVAPYGPELGICGDTGHWVRSGYDPVKTLRLVAPRLVSVHFKDLSEAGVKTARDRPWGSGVSDAAGQIAELHAQKFPGYVFVEYEFMSDQLDTEVALCVDFYRRTLVKLAR